MYYHVRIDYYDILLKANQTLFDFDLTDEQGLQDSIIKPYLFGSDFLFKGVLLNSKKNEVRQLRVFRSNKMINECVQIANSRIPRNVLMIYRKSDLLPYDGLVEECTSMINEIQKEVDYQIHQNDNNKKTKDYDKNSVFVVHGHDNEARLKIELFLKGLGLNPVILFKKSDEGDTIIEKFEKHSNVGFAIVLYTYCDDGKDKNEEKNHKRARQNVVFEHGYMIAKLGRSRVCALRKGEIELPGDYQGVIFKNMDDNDGWQLEIARELNAAGYTIDMNNLLK